MAGAPPDFTLKPRSRAACIIARAVAYEIAVRQFDEGLEVGRVTWHLAPGVRKRQAEARKNKKNT